jgi:hypothetical protein
VDAAFGEGDGSDTDVEEGSEVVDEDFVDSTAGAFFGKTFFLK